MNHKQRLILATFTAYALAAHATEGGGSTYPRGIENYLAGAIPPPGLYWLGYGSVYAADKLKDSSGNDIPIPGFKVRAEVAALRGIWSTPYQALGGTIALHAVVPLVNLSVDAAGQHQTKTGIGDIVAGIGLSTHYSPQLHTALVLDFSLPTGGYNKADLANIGRNYAAAMPTYAITYVDPTGFNGDLKLTLSLNQRNKDTDYQSGKEFFVDYAAGWGLGNGWTVGIGGHLWRQLENDKFAGASLPGSKTRSQSIGPSIKYDNGKGWLITAKLQSESGARNTTSGNAFWIKTVLPF